MPIEVNTDSNNNINIDEQAEQGNAEITLQSQSQIINQIGTTALYGPKGEKGDKGDTGETGPKGETGSTGATGNGIVNIEKASTVGLVDTYHVNYTNGGYDSFNVTNGKDGTGAVTDVTVNGVSVLDGSVAKVLVPTDNAQLTNGAMYITGITSSDVTTALGYTPLSNLTKYGADLSYSSNTLQLLDQDGNSLGNSVTIQSSPDIDGISITTNSDDELQTVGVIDQNNTTNAIKTWTGTKAQYDAIQNKDGSTLYNITDDSDVTFALLELLFPVGSIYIGAMSTCPLQTLGVGTWQLKTSRFLVDKYVSGSDWWELYSDGWCEQGGYATATSSSSAQQIALLKSFTNTNYSVFVTRTAATDNYLQVTVTAQTTANFTTGYSCNKYWRACGYTSEITQLNQWERIA